MKMEDLKTGFWGYRKFSVCQYIAAMEESFSAKLLEKDEENRALLERERQRVRELEEELSELRRQYEAQREEQMLIASTLLDAQRYAEDLKAEAEARSREAEKTFEAVKSKWEEEVDRHTARLNSLRERLRATLQEMDGSLEQLAQNVEETRSDAPGDLLFFRRRTEWAE